MSGPPGRLDAWTHRALRSELPGLDVAFDDATVHRLIAIGMLAGGSGGRALVRCERAQAVFDAGPSCSVRYRVGIEDARTRGVSEALVLLRLFPGALAAREHFACRLRPLAEAARGRAELAAFVTPIALFESHAMTASAFPIDGDLPMLVPATDAGGMAPVLRQALGEGEGVAPLSRVEVAHYPRQHHCVIRYGFQHGAPDGSVAAERIVYGKIAADGRGEATMTAVPELRERLAGRRGRNFRVPQALGLVPSLSLVLIESVPGSPQIGPLLKARLRGMPGGPVASRPEGGPGALEEAVDWAATVAAGLHDSGVGAGTPRLLADELHEMLEGLDLLDRLTPSLAMDFREWVEAVQASAAAAEPWAPVFSHGDYSPSQIFLDGAECALIDFDTVCQAEPMLDLGTFVAYLRLTARKAGGDTFEARALADGLADRFLTAYVRERELVAADAARLRERVPPYEMLSLLRLVLHSWRKFKPERLARALALVRERLPYLVAGAS